MEQNTSISTEETENRRGVLKKIGSLGAFTIPAIASLQLSEVQVHASGITPQTELDRAWNAWWGQNDTFWGFGQPTWSTNKNNWFTIWQWNPHI